MFLRRGLFIAILLPHLLGSGGLRERGHMQRVR